MVRPEAARRDIELKIREQPGHVQRPMLRLGRIDRRMAHHYIHDVEAARGNDVARRDIGIGQPLDLAPLRRPLTRTALAPRPTPSREPARPNASTTAAPRPPPTPPPPPP